MELECIESGAGGPPRSRRLSCWLRQTERVPLDVTIWPVVLENVYVLLLPPEALAPMV